MSTLTRTKNTAELSDDDLVSEAFTRMLATIQDHSGPSDDFRPYLIGVVRNLARDGHRCERRTETHRTQTDADRLLSFVHGVEYPTGGIRRGRSLP
jgi:DNA-directed RNA polymerase specialized sigma24 family protein